MKLQNKTIVREQYTITIEVDESNDAIKVRLSSSYMPSDEIMHLRSSSFTNMERLVHRIVNTNKGFLDESMQYYQEAKKLLDS